MAYATRDDLAARFGDDEIGQLEASGSDLQDGTQRTTKALNDASDTVDGYLSTRYATPLQTVPSLVVGWTCDIARYRMWDEQAPDEVRRRFEDAIAQLRDVARGNMSLPNTPDGKAQPGAGVAFATYANERVFTGDTLEGF